MAPFTSLKSAASISHEYIRHSIVDFYWYLLPPLAALVTLLISHERTSVLK